MVTRPYSSVMLILLVLICTILAPWAEGRGHGDDGNLPFIFILGAQKGGSSSLFEFLLEHPLLCKGEHKEPHFFDDPLKYGWARKPGLPGKIPPRDAYLALFPQDSDCTKKHTPYRYIDATTMFHASEQISLAMWNFYTPEERSELRLIVVLREPVSRDFSWFEQVTRDQLGGNPKERGGGGGAPQLFRTIQTIKEGDAQHSRHIKRSGRYVDQLKNITTYFRRDQIFVLASDYLFHNTTDVMVRLGKFLDVEFVNKWTTSLPHDNHLGRKEWAGIVDCIVSHVPKLDCSHRDVLGEFYKPYNAALYSWLNQTRAQASPYEPPFPPFGDYKRIPCVADARKEFDELIKDNLEGICSNKGVPVLKHQYAPPSPSSGGPSDSSASAGAEGATEPPQRRMRAATYR